MHPMGGWRTGPLTWFLSPPLSGPNFERTPQSFPEVRYTRLVRQEKGEHPAPAAAVTKLQIENILDLAHATFASAPASASKFALLDRDKPPARAQQAVRSPISTLE